MNKLGINLWNWAPGLSDACCGLPTKAAEMGFTALELPMTQPAVSPTLRDEVRGSGLEVSLCAAMGAGRDLSSFDADVRAATMQYLTDCLQTGAALGAVVLAGPLYAGGGKRHTLPRRRLPANGSWLSPVCRSWRAAPRSAASALPWSR